MLNKDSIKEGMEYLKEIAGRLKEKAFSIDENKVLTIHEEYGPKIEEGAFAGRQDFSSLKGDFVNEVGAGAFAGCKNLKKIDLPIVSDVRNNAFKDIGDELEIHIFDPYQCGDIYNFSFNDEQRKLADDIDSDKIRFICYNFKDKRWTKTGMFDEKTGTFCDDGMRDCDMDKPDSFAGTKRLKKVVISINQEKIGDRAFAGCENLESVEIENVVKIGDRAFAGCENLKSIKMPEIREIGEEVFAGIKNLGIYVKNRKQCKMIYKKLSPEQVYEIEDREPTAIKLYYGVDQWKPKCAIREGTLFIYEEYGPEIKEGEFANRKDIRKVIAKHITTIGDRAFAGCENLSYIEIPSIQNTGAKVFDGIKELEIFCNCAGREKREEVLKSLSKTQIESSNIKIDGRSGASYGFSRERKRGNAYCYKVGGEIKYEDALAFELTSSDSKKDNIYILIPNIYMLCTEVNNLLRGECNIEAQDKVKEIKKIIDEYNKAVERAKTDGKKGAEIVNKDNEAVLNLLKSSNLVGGEDLKLTLGDYHTNFRILANLTEEAILESFMASNGLRTGLNYINCSTTNQLDPNGENIGEFDVIKINDEKFIILDKAYLENLKKEQNEEVFWQAIINYTHVLKMSEWYSKGGDLGQVCYVTEGNKLYGAITGAECKSFEEFMNTEITIKIPRVEDNGEYTYREKKRTYRDIKEYNVHKASLQNNEECKCSIFYDVDGKIDFSSENLRAMRWPCWNGETVYVLYEDFSVLCKEASMALEAGDNGRFLQYIGQVYNWVNKQWTLPELIYANKDLTETDKENIKKAVKYPREYENIVNKNVIIGGVKTTLNAIYAHDPNFEEKIQWIYNKEHGECDFYLVNCKDFNEANFVVSGIDKYGGGKWVYRYIKLNSNIPRNAKEFYSRIKSLRDVACFFKGHYVEKMDSNLYDIVWKINGLIGSCPEEEFLKRTAIDSWHGINPITFGMLRKADSYELDKIKNLIKKLTEENGEESSIISSINEILNKLNR